MFRYLSVKGLITVPLTFWSIATDTTVPCKLLTAYYRKKKETCNSPRERLEVVIGHDLFKSITTNEIIVRI